MKKRPMQFAETIPQTPPHHELQPAAKKIKTTVPKQERQVTPLAEPTVKANATGAFWNGQLTWMTNDGTGKPMEQQCLVSAISARPQVSGSLMEANHWPAQLKLSSLIPINADSFQFLNTIQVIPLIQLVSSPNAPSTTTFDLMVKNFESKNVGAIIRFGPSNTSSPFQDAQKHGIIIAQKDKKLYGFVCLRQIPLSTLVERLNQRNNQSTTQSRLQAQVQQQQQLRIQQMMGQNLNAGQGLTAHQLQMMQQQQRKNM